MSIKRHLIILLSLLSLVIMAMALLGGWALYQADLGATRIYHERVMTLRRLELISDLYADNIHNVGRRFIGGQATLAETVTVMTAARDRAFHEWNNHRQTQMTRVERQLSQEIEATMRDVDLQIDALRNSLQAASSGAPAITESDEAGPDDASRINGEIEPNLDRLASLFSSLSDQQQLSADADYRQTHQSLGWGLVGVLGAALTAVIGLALVVWVVIRRVTRPLGQALLLDQAGLPREAGTPRDEISAVVEAMRRLRHNLTDLSSLHAEQAHKADAFRAQLEAIFRHAPVGVYIKDIEGHMLVVSDHATRLWGHSHDEMIGKLDTSWSEPDEAALIQATNRQVLETGEPVTVEYRGQRPNDYDWLLAVKFPVRDDSGKIVSLGGFDMDISASKRQLEDLRLASAHLQNVKRLAHMYYWWRRVDPISGETKHYHIDREFLALTGQDDLSNDNTIYANQVIHPDDRTAMIGIYTDFTAHKFDDYQVEYRILRPDDRVVHVRAWVERMRDSDTGDFLIAGVVQDISQEKQRENQLLTAKTEAEASDRAKSEFLTNMSHELRTPLNAVIGYSDLLRMNGVVQENRQISDYVDAVNESGRNLLEIINAILDMSRLESSDPNLQESVFPIAEVIAEIERQVTARAHSKEIALQFPTLIATPAGAEADKLDPDLRIRAESRAFRQILLNVLSNAIKFTGHGGTVALRPAIRHNGDLAIEIADSGVGIEANLVPLLTIPFTQAGSAWTRRKGGIGLGLAIAKKLLDLHQGHLEITSQPGIGTRITLIFPATRLQWKGAPAAAVDISPTGQAQHN